MAGCRVRQDREIVQILKDVSSVSELENSYQCIKIKDIQQEIDFSACFVKGVLTTVKPSFLTSRGWIMKVSIKDLGVHNQPGSSNDSNPQDVISIFLKGNFVEKCKVVKEGDILVITGAQVEKSSRDGHQLNIIADERNETLKIWIMQDPGKNKNFGTIASVGESVVQKPVPVESETTAHSIGKVGNTEPPTKRSKVILEPKATVYTKLADLKANTIVDVYGVVKFFKSPFKTRGSDFVCTVSLSDPSLDSLEKGFKLVLFSKSKEMLPVVKSVGDIIRFHRIAVGEFKGELQGKLLPQSSWLVFEIDSLDTSQPRASSSNSYNLTDHEKDIIEELRSWASQKEYLNKKFAITNLKDLSTSQTFINLLCQVVSKCYTMSGNGIVLTLWDGSFPACRSIQVEPISEQRPLTSDELVKKSANRCVEVFLYENHMEGAVKNVCPGDFVCIRNVHLKEEKNSCSLTTDDSKSVQSHPQVSLTVHRGTICGRGVELLSLSDPVVSLSTTMKFISEAETLLWQQEVKSQVTTTTTAESKDMDVDNTSTTACVILGESSNVVEEVHQNHAVTKEVNRALQTSCTITEHPCIPFTSLKDIKACSTVPYKFRCRVKAVMYLPSVKNFIQRSCQSCKYLLPESSWSAVNLSAPVLCPQCNQETSLVYLFSFVLEDESGLLHVMVFDKDVINFFPELPSPEDFLDQPNLQETVHEWMISMTQNPENSIEFINQDPGGDKRPWLELCILSYFPNANQDGGKLLYRVFDSTFVTDNV